MDNNFVYQTYGRKNDNPEPTISKENMDKIKEDFEIEVQRKINNYLEKEYGNIAIIKDAKQKKITVTHEKYNMYGLFEDNEWKLASHYPDSIFQVLHDLGIIEFIDKTIEGV